MNFTNQASSICFYCGNQINRGKQTHVWARIRHIYKHSEPRESGRNFHVSCFEKFQQNGRPFNPGTEYEVIEHESVSPEENTVSSVTCEK